jgi:hypothetical protein
MSRQRSAYLFCVFFLVWYYKCTYIVGYPVYPFCPPFPFFFFLFFRQPLTVRAYIPQALPTKYPRALCKQVVLAVMATVRGTYVRCIKLIGSVAWITFASPQHRDTFLTRGLAIDGIRVEVRGAESSVLLCRFTASLVRFRTRTSPSASVTMGKSRLLGWSE